MNLLLLRGLGREAGHWGSWPERLRSLDGVGEVRCLDLPGVGTELGQRGPNDIRKMVMDLSGRFEDGEGPWCLVTISLGAMVAMEWIYQEPDRFSGLVAMNTSAGGLSRRFERVRTSALKEFFRILTLRNVEVRERTVLGLTSNSEEGRRSALEGWIEIARSRPVPRPVLIGQLWAANKFYASPLVDLPKLFLVSEQDRIVKPSCTRKLADYHGGQLHSHPSAGHDLPLDAPEWSAARIGEFLAGLL